MERTGVLKGENVGRGMKCRCPSRGAGDDGGGCRERRLQPLINSSCKNLHWLAEKELER